MTHTHTHFFIFELKICGTAGATQTACYLQPQVRTRQHVKIMQTHRKYEHTQFHRDAYALRVNKVRDGGFEQWGVSEHSAGNLPFLKRTVRPK